MKNWQLVVTLIDPDTGSKVVKTHYFESTGVVTPQQNGPFISWYAHGGTQIGYNINSVLSYVTEEVFDD